MDATGKVLQNSGWVQSTAPYGSSKAPGMQMRGKPLTNGRGSDHNGGLDQTDPLRRTVGEVVGSVFYGTLLQRMRETKLKGPVGHGGRGEEVFAAQLHGVLAERMGMADSGQLKEAIYKRLRKQQRLLDGAQGASQQNQKEDANELS